MSKIGKLRGTFELQACPHPLLETIYGECVFRAGYVYIPRDEGDYLYSLVRHLQPRLTVEVGMANGISTLFLAQGLRDNGHGRHVAIDPFQSTDWANAGIELIREAGLESWVELVEKPSHQALPELEQAGEAAQLVFIDGSHLFDYVIADFLGTDRILDVGGLVAFDDSDWPAITQAIRYVLANRHYAVADESTVVEMPPGRPTLSSRALRGAARLVPPLARKLRPSFLVPSDRLGFQGRCVALRKLSHDDRNSQSRFHHDF